MKSPVPPLSSGSSSVVTKRQRSKLHQRSTSIVEGHQHQPPLPPPPPLSMGSSPAMVPSHLPSPAHNNKKKDNTASSSRKSTSTHKPRRRRTKSEDEDDEDFFTSSEPITSASLRRIGLLLAAGCILFTWDLFHLMGYIERIEEKDASPNNQLPLMGRLRGGTVVLTDQKQKKNQTSARLPQWVP
eukprot:scaffold1827_cov167-Amphora_coffeaeformis.AAC.5